MLRIYGASKLKHAPLWKWLREEWPEVHFVSRWPWDHVGKVPDTPEFARVFWKEDQEDVSHADVLVVYAELEDKLRGALVEAGMAIMHGIPVLLVGPPHHPDFSTWQYHPQVHRVATLAEAHTWMLDYDR